jgi:hypothetical protein
MDVICEPQEVLLQNQRNIHWKMQVEEPFIEFRSVEYLSAFLDPFASLTAVKMVYFRMDAPDTLGTHARRKHATTIVSDSDEESDNDDDDYEEDDE